MNNTPDETVTINLEGIDRGHHKMQYRGVNCAKCPFDYVIYQMIISQLKPDLILEIGANEGGSALYMADLLALNGKGVVHTIDIADRVHELVKKNPLISFFFNGWDEYDTTQLKNFETILVIEDSSHHYQNTIDAISKFAPYVSVGSYLIVEDGIIDALGRSEEFGGGPVKAVKEFLAAHNNFSLDTYWSDFFGKNATFNTIGYLKRTS